MSSNWHFEPASLADLSDINASYQLGGIDGGLRILIVSYEGEYRFGSAGNPDASFMSGVAAAGVEAFAPDAVIFDFSRLKYKWGDMLECVYGTAPACINGETRFAVVIGPDCGEAVRTLELGEFSTEPLQTIPWAHETRDSACNYLRQVLG